MDGIVRFGDFSFHGDTGQLWRGTVEIRLTPKTAGVLRLLVECRGSVVSKQQLLDRIWGGTIVTDDALSSCILELRRALGDDPKQPRFIETRHRRGYLFVGAIERTHAAAPSEGPLAIAVLPFSDISLEHDQGYFCDGLAVELISRLSQVPGLRVVSRTASFRFRDVGADVRSVGSHLGARFLLEGSIRKTNEHLRVAVQLVDVASGYQTWARQFDRLPDDVFAIQNEITDGISLTLTGSAVAPSGSSGPRIPKTVAAAYEYYLRGLQYLPQMTEAGLRRSADMFGQAIALDPSYGPAFAGQAMVFGTLYEWFGAGQDNLARADDASAKAVALAPSLAEARVARGFSHALSRRYAEAVAEFTEAIRINPNLFEAYYYFGRASFANGDTARASELFRQAAEVRREDFQSPILLAQTLRMLGRHDESLACNREGARRAERALALNPTDSRALSLGAHAILHDGQVERAREWSRRAVELHPDDMSTLINAALVNARLNHKEAALDLLERAFAQGWGKRDWIEHDPDYDGLREDPRFQRLLDQLR